MLELTMENNYIANKVLLPIIIVKVIILVLKVKKVTQ